MKVLFFLFLLLNGQARELSLFTKLTPAGSLEAASKRLGGSIVFDGETLRASKLWLKVSTLETGIDLRNQHLQQYLGSENHPFITMTNIEGKEGKGTGLLKISGVEKPVSFLYKEEDEQLVAKFTIDTNDFNLKKMKYFNIGVDNIVKITVKEPIKKVKK